MNQDKLFLIAIGGTGMRCLEAFTHMCAIGMFDSREIEILTLDTDETNGNKSRVENLIRLYNRIKSSSGNDGGNPNSNTFFSAKLNLYRFWTVYSGSGRENYRNLSKLDVGKKNTIEENKLLSDLFLDQSVQDFNLAHGYRAQTHLGSHLMYHGFIEAARSLLKGVDVKSQERELQLYIDKLALAGPNARVFVFGSVFGGTGASSIPVIPKALDDAMRIRSNEKTSLDKNVKFGTTLLTEYFSFKKPDANQMSTKDDSVIADASFFSLNSQAALQFYQSDPTVQMAYKYMYHIGWPLESKSVGDKNSKTITGGAEQQNPCHIAELIAACAAYDFFTKKTNFENLKTEVLFKSFDYNDNTFSFNFDDFVGKDNNAGKVFANRMGAFLALAHIVLSRNKAAFGDQGMQGFIKQLNNQKIFDYDAISQEECKEIDSYMKLFAYDFSGEEIKEGWLYQIKSTVGSGQFLFDDKAFTKVKKELDDIDVGTLFKDSQYHWDKGGLLSNRYGGFVNRLIKEGVPTEEQKVTTTKEKFLAHIFNAISNSHKNLV